jgi:hypothetical protein
VVKGDSARPGEGSADAGLTPTGFPIRWPTTALGWVGLALLSGAVVYEVYKGQIEFASILLGNICLLLGMDKRQALSIAMSFRAATAALAAAHNSEAASARAADANTAALGALDAANQATQAATQAASTAVVAATTAAAAASTAEVVRDAVRDIQDNPNMPGTEGWMRSRDSSR